MTSNNRPSVNPWLVLALISIPVFIGALDLTIVSAFLPELVLDLELPLQTRLDDAAWIVSGYLLAYTISMTFMGRVSDLIGRRWVYIASLVIFIAGSILVATAEGVPTDFVYHRMRSMGERPDRNDITLWVIVAGRVVQAFGAGAMVPVSLALVGDLFPPLQRARPLGIVGAVDTLGWVLGHLYGGIMVQFVRWQVLFWINVPVTIGAIALTWWALRNIPQPRKTGRFDIIGTLLIVGAIIALNIGLGANIEVSGTAASFEDLSVIPSYAVPLMFVALALLIAFIFAESRIRDPLIPLSMFRKRNISAGSLSNLFIGFSLMIGLVSVPILVNVQAADPEALTSAALKVGILLSALTVPMALAAVPGGWLADRAGFRWATASGLVLALVGFVLIWQTWHLEISSGWVAVEMAIVGIGLGLTFSPISAGVINAADEDRRGIASALVIILRLIGMTVSISSLTTISLRRVTALAATVFGTDVAVDPLQATEAYARITVKVLAELGLVGAVVCGLALIPALMLRPQGSHLSDL